jgi:multidrug efflux pump subunit AcrA (membrane-fusion protein)
VQQVNQGFTEIRAPFDGVVLAKNANVGDLITPFSNAAGSQGAVLTLADLSTLEVEADVSEGSLAKVQLDQPVEIQLDALPGQRFRGQVVSIVPTVDRAKATVMTKLRFEQLDARVLPEMSAKAVFLSQRASDAEMQPVLAAPPKALDAEGAVWKLVKGRIDGGQSVKRVAVQEGPDDRRAGGAAGRGAVQRRPPGGGAPGPARRPESGDGGGEVSVDAAAAPPPLIRIRQLAKSYRRGDQTIPVLAGIDLDVASGDFVA